MTQTRPKIFSAHILSGISATCTLYLSPNGLEKTLKQVTCFRRGKERNDGENPSSTICEVNRDLRAIYVRRGFEKRSRAKQETSPSSAQSDTALSWAHIG